MSQAVFSVINSTNQKESLKLPFMYVGMKDVVVTLEDEKTPVVFIEFPMSMGSWQMTMYRGSTRNGPVVSKMLYNIGVCGCGESIMIKHMPSRQLVETGIGYGLVSRYHRFEWDGQAYVWESEVVTRNLNLYRCRDQKLIAYLDVAFMSASKMATLIVHPEAFHFIDIIIGSAYCFYMSLKLSR